MGKKVKKKARSGQKEKRGASMSPKAVVQQRNSYAGIPDDGVEVIKHRGLCSHIDRGINLDKLSSKLGSSESLACEDCQGNVVDGQAKKGKGKQVKKVVIKSKPESQAIWVCLECGHFSCGGVGLPTIPQSHAVRHAKQKHHPLVVHYENHQLLWCYPCSKLIAAEKSEMDHKGVLSEVEKILKVQTGQGSAVDVEDVWFGSGCVTNATKSDYFSGSGADGRGDYSIRGLVNLGNTCFFNSVMQNLLAIHSFRDYFCKLDDSVGPLTAAMRKLFLETSSKAGLRSAINPRSLFGSLCTKAPQFRGYQQHDSHELLRCLLDGWSTEELSARKHSQSSDASNTDPTFVDTLFSGRLSSTVSCLKCGHSSSIYEPFLDLSLPVPTKKPLARSTQPVGRGKKSKLAPKKGGRNLSKSTREANTIQGQGESVSDQSIGGNPLGEVSVAPPSDQLVLFQGDSAFSDPNTIALYMGFTAEDLSAMQKPKDQQEVDNVGEQSISSDNLTWMDYLEPNPVTHDTDIASETDENSAIQSFTNENTLGSDISLSITLNNSNEGSLVHADSETSLNNAEDFNSVELVVLAQQHALCQVEDKQNVKIQCDERCSPDCSFIKEVVECDADLGQGSDSCKQVCFDDSSTSGRDTERPSEIQDSEVRLLPKEEDTVKIQCDERCSPECSFVEEVECDADLGHGSDSGKQGWSEDSNTSGRDNERPSEIQDAEVRLLPKNEDASCSGEVLGTEIEASLVVLGDEQDSLDFDGFGDLFNEPEVSLDLKPLGHPVSVGSDATKTGVIGNSSESDPDEVDDADAPVSIESCLALFTKPELLSKDEHAWQCDNCSKVLREQRIRLRRKCKIGNSTGLLDHGNTCNKVRSMNGNLEKEVDLSGGCSPRLNWDIYENGRHELGKHPESEINEIGFHSENSEPQVINACPDSLECPGFSNQNLNSCHGECDSDKSGFPQSNSHFAKCESEVSGEDEVESENLKVKRDATKSVYINKSPSVLTIHLKRFTQDARGRLSKLNGHVNFKETIDLKPYLDPRCTDKDTKFAYRLVGVVEHSGTMRGGHYVAYVRGTKNCGDYVWYHASDVHVRKASLEEVLGCEAYILFYEEI